uniref:Uncharacterized protein n=1 Tax=Anguilla anguilla TaxID=7936 RepID=A0A0E9TG27_ANGAN
MMSYHLLVLNAIHLWEDLPHALTMTGGQNHNVRKKFVEWIHYRIFSPKPEQYFILKKVLQ